MNEVPINRPEDVVVMFVEAWNHRDPDAVAALFDTDAEFGQRDRSVSRRN